MKKLLFNEVNKKAFIEGKEILLNQKKLKFLWLLAAHPTKTFSIDDIVEKIMQSGIMLHEKKFINMIAQNSCRRTGVPILKKGKEKTFPSKNKFMKNDFDYL